jgi:polyisoprenoid-binding protein YceI
MAGARPVQVLVARSNDTLKTKTPVRFVMDAEASLFTVHALASGMIALVAHSPKFAIRKFEGTLTFVPDCVSKSSLELTIHLDSLDLLDEVAALERREIERVMFKEVLETHRHPIATFKSTEVTVGEASEHLHRLTISGDLHFHGVTGNLVIESHVLLGEQTVKAQGAFVLSQSQFGLKIASIAGKSIKLKDDLKFAYFMIGRRSPAS